MEERSQVSETGTQKRTLQPENKPLNPPMLLILGKCKTLLICHHTLLSKAHFHILAMTLAAVRNIPSLTSPYYTRQAVQHRMQLYTPALGVIAGSVSHSSLHRGLNFLMGTQLCSKPLGRCRAVPAPKGKKKS